MTETNIWISGKLIAISGSTGGLGRELCFLLAELGASLIMIDRNPDKAQALERELSERYPSLDIIRVTADMEDISSVRRATEELISLSPDIFIANAGAYHIPRHACSTGYDNILQINFISPYFMIRTLSSALPNIKTVVVGSLAHSLVRTDENDLERSKTKSSIKAYGNAKRYLMLSAAELFKNEPNRLSITHPGISPTGITAGYPRAASAIIKYPMKLLFSSPKKAARSILHGVLNPIPYGYWAGPTVLGIWGSPKTSCVKVLSSNEAVTSYGVAERLYREISD